MAEQCTCKFAVALPKDIADTLLYVLEGQDPPENTLLASAAQSEQRTGLCAWLLLAALGSACKASLLSAAEGSSPYRIH